MKLIIGGYAQGKLNYALQRYGAEGYKILEGELAADVEGDERARLVNHFHLWIKKRISEGGCPEKEIDAFLKRYPDCVIISDEIGNGIVPADASERQYRERTGRILVELANRAEEVVRVICGIGQKIK